MSQHLDAVLRAAIDQGVLETATTDLARQQRPWQVLVMTAIAAWFAALPLGLLVGLLFLTGSHSETIALVISPILLIGAVLCLRKAGLALFLEQLAIPCLIVGAALLFYGLGGFDHYGRYEMLLGAVAIVPFAVALLVPQDWLRVLLGAAGALLAGLALPYGAGLPGVLMLLSWECLAAAWLIGLAVLARLQETPAHARSAAVLEAVLSGVGAMALLGLAYRSGRTSLLSASLPDSYFDSGMGAALASHGDAFSVACACAATAWSAYRWPVLRAPWFGALALTAALLCWFIGWMGAVLLMLAVCVTSGRRNLAVLAGGVALWMIGAFYYQLHWPLMHKALLLIGCAMLVGAIARFGLPRALLAPEPMPTAVPAPQPARDPRWKRGLVAGAGVLALLVANAAIWQKEDLIRGGSPVFVELAPVDPRSLMQGDYMALDYAFPQEIQAPEGRAMLVARRAPNGVATLLELHDGRPLAKDELLIEVIGKRGRPLIVSDAWYFKEGEAERWAKARYGEFRVDAHGKALLVGLRGPQLEAL